MSNESKANEKLPNKLRSSYRKCKGLMLSVHFQDYEEDIQNLEIFDDDVWVTSFPKSGTTWTMEMVWLICNDCDYEGAKTYLEERFPFLEYSAVVNFEKDAGLHKIGNLSGHYIDSVKYVKEFSGKRFIKSHLSWDLLPLQIQNGTKHPKIIHVIRNPKDVFVSLYYHYQTLFGFKGTLEEFFNLFINGEINFSPYWNNVSSYWSRRHYPNILIISFEEMKNDLNTVIRRVATFLQKELTDSQVEKLIRHLSFEEMKKNEAVNFEHFREILRNLMPELGASSGSFMRCGKIGSYKDTLTYEMIEVFDKWIEENNKLYKIHF